MRAPIVIAAIAFCCGMAHAEPVSTSAYVAGADGTRLALDVWRDEGATAAPAPALVQFTRYWRAFRNGGAADPTTIAAFTRAGYRVVIVDVRGTGASFGSRNAEFSDAEVADFAAVFDWIVAQDWSNGRVATMGSSYLGNTAEFAAMTRHPAVRAVVPRFSDYSEYRHAVRPGGVRNSVIAEAWPAFAQALDRNDACAAFAGGPGPDCAPGAPWLGGVRPVDGEEGALDAAIAEHTRNADLARTLSNLIYADDSFAEDGDPRVTLDAVSPSQRWRRIDAARVPAYHWASWFDGGTADGVLTRFAQYRGPMRVIIGAWTHGGGRRADPFAPPGTPPDLGPSEQLADIIAFLDPLLKGDGRTDITREVRYFTLGANVWRTTQVWPPRGSSMHRWRLRPDGSLSRGRASRGADLYEVDFSATTGRTNRWHTQLGEAVDYGDRTAADTKLLTYTGEAFARDVEISGTPVVQIALTPSQPDGALFVYLEAVLPDGRTLYISEGVRRLQFTRLVSMFTRAEAADVRVGQEIVMRMSLNPISIRLPAGSRLRLALAGADADTFERLPLSGAPLRFSIARARSYVDVPVILDFP